MISDHKIRMVHLQLTRKCNLRCYFCGQWGKQGSFSTHANQSDLALNEWSSVIDSLRKYRDESGLSPNIILWGGEPLVSPLFDAVTQLLQKHEFRLGIITNGVLIDRHAELLQEAFDAIYISLDGPAEIHNKIRGPGVFEKISANLHLLHEGTAKTIFMTVISKDNISIASKIPEILAPLQPDKIILQPLIYLTQQEIKEYAHWLEKTFNQKAVDIYSWQNDNLADYPERLKKITQTIQQKILSDQYSLPVEILSHGPGSPCLSPCSHLHVTYNGDVTYCTDFYDFKAGNVRNNDLIDIFNNSKSETFRKEISAGHCPTCNHCSWRNNQTYQLDCYNL